MKIHFTHFTPASKSVTVGHVYFGPKRGRASRKGLACCCCCSPPRGMPTSNPRRRVESTPLVGQAERGFLACWCYAVRDRTVALWLALFVIGLALSMKEFLNAAIPTSLASMTATLHDNRIQTSLTTVANVGFATGKMATVWLVFHFGARTVITYAASIGGMGTPVQPATARMTTMSTAPAA